jgi:hypothetical protein
VLVVAKLTFDRTDYRNEHRSLPERHTEGIEIFVASNYLNYQFFIGKLSPSLNEPAAAKIKSINAQIPKPPNVNSIARPVPTLPM